MSSIRKNKQLAAFQRFLHLESTAGILLIVGTVIALLIANSPLHEGFEEFLHRDITLGFGDHAYSQPVHFWINDGLMTIFFFVVGLEIKRELRVGELSSLRKALLPIGAAAGGMLIPILFFMVFNHGTDTFSGWSIPMATDIAFSLGILVLLGSRIPLSLKLFLTALAIVDDLGGVLMISAFHSEAISVAWILTSASVVAVWLLLKFAGIRNLFVYVILGAIFWIVFLNTGIHPTISGVVYAMVVPVRTRINPQQFITRVRAMLGKFEESGSLEDGVFATRKQREALTEIEESAAAIRSPLQRLEQSLHPWVVFLIMPIFALSNAGIKLEASTFATVTDPLFIGIVAGLFVGKQLGVLGFTWVLVKAGVTDLPRNVTWKQVYGMACLAGIGFTMAIFMANVSFDDPAKLSTAKLAILVASLMSGLLGYFVLRTCPKIHASEKH